mgnify:CR=1 FL=1
MKVLLKLIVVIWASAFLLVACSGPSAEELASLAAKGYYEHLLKGEYDSFLEGMNGLDSIPDDYREQLLAGYKQFMHQQEQAHRGIREVRIVNAKTDTIQKYTSVFLVLCFGDSTNEEVVVPMVEHEGRWRMK